MLRRRRTWLLLGLLVVTASAVVLIRRGGGSGEPPHPKAWDPQVLPLVQFVEQARGLRFRHPVEIDYLSDAGFRKEVAGDDSSSGPESGLAAADAEATDRALGLPLGPDGLAAAGHTLSGEGITAFYDDGTDRVDVRGTDLTVEVRATVVHELTHALQDQHFDISKQGTFSSDDRNGAYEAVVEGDALRTENAYVDSLSPADQDAYDQESDAGDADYNSKTAGVPDWLSATTDFPYSVGEPFTRALDGTGGRPAVDRAFQSPPAAEALVMAPPRYLRGERPVTVADPAVPAGAKVLKRNELGSLRWLLLLAERLPAADALAAADGWAGDAWVAYSDGGRVCVKAAVAGSTPAGTNRLMAVLGRWAAAMPAGSGATVERRDPAAEVTSCDPGVAAVRGPSLPGSQVTAAMKQLIDRASAFADASVGPRERTAGEETVSSRGG